jgi:hypothetical protein
MAMLWNIGEYREEFDSMKTDRTRCCLHFTESCLALLPGTSCRKLPHVDRSGGAKDTTVSSQGFGSSR